MLTRLAVWGDPIAHSRSPQLHAAAYRALGLDWDYDRRRVAEDEFDAALTGLDATWRGLSLTMPLKGAAYAAAAERDRAAELTGAVNTLLLSGIGPRGFNTDIGGIVRALRETGIETLDTARIVGAGATATSALVALAELGARRVEVVARRPEAVAALQTLGAQIDVDVVSVPFDGVAHPVPVTISTLPGTARVPDAVAAALAATGGLLFDVAYGHDAQLTAEWERVGAPAMNGLAMLLQQAVLQVRIFVAGDPGIPLPGEPAVIAAMRDALMRD